jgi:hypothetical protein
MYSISKKRHSTRRRDPMSGKTTQSDEERRINLRSFYIGIAIGVALIILYTILYFAGLAH